MNIRNITAFEFREWIEADGKHLYTIKRTVDINGCYYTYVVIKHNLVITYFPFTMPNYAISKVVSTMIELAKEEYNAEEKRNNSN